MRPLSWDQGKLTVLDQRLLPTRVKWVKVSGSEEAFEAIRNMTVRGAPLIGVVAAFGLALEAQGFRVRSLDEFHRRFVETSDHLNTARPTAVNLRWALDRMSEGVRRAHGVSEAKELALLRAEEIMKYEEETSKRIGEVGERLIEDGDTVMTHCNAGSLATVDYGTALAPIRFAIARGKKVKVIATETRPALQGARLTAFELMRDGIDVTLISDTMVGYTMSQGMVDSVIVGADRVLKDGHVINKIGTYQVATMAERHGLPFYSAMPWSTIDMTTKLSDVRIEQRSPREVEMVRGRRIAPKGVKVFNPAFDITPPGLVAALITDRGIISPPFQDSLAKADKESRNQLEVRSS